MDWHAKKTSTVSVTLLSQRAGGCVVNDRIMWVCFSPSLVPGAVTVKEDVSNLFMVNFLALVLYFNI